MTRTNGRTKKWSPASFMGAGVVRPERSKLQTILSISTIGNAVFPGCRRQHGRAEPAEFITPPHLDEVLLVDKSGPSGP